MSTKITIEKIKTLVESKGGKLLTTEYKNNYQKLDVICSEGHSWHPTVKHLNRNGGCGLCYNSTEKRMASKAQPHKLQEVKAFAKARGGECISEHYINNRESLKFRCSEGHEWETNFKVINHGSWCPTCSLIKEPNQKYYYEAIEIAKDRKGVLLSNEYISAHSNMEWQCSNNHKWFANLNSIKNGGWCPECSSGFSERICKKAFELLFNQTFIKTRPAWLVYTSGKRLELDGYCESLGIAFEHNGQQHYENIYNSNDFENIKERDFFKVQKCNEYKVHLIVIPSLFSILKIENLITYIISECDKLGIKIPNRNVTIKDLDIEHIKFNNLSFEERLKNIIDISNNKNGKCLSTHYNSNSMKFQCGCGFVWNTAPSNITNGHWCLRCAHKIPITIEDMQKIAIDRGGLCLSTKYINNSTKLEWQCSCGNVWPATYNAIQRGDWCPKCAVIRRSNLRRIGIDTYKEIAKEKGGRCLSTTISSCFDKLEFECAEGHRWFSRADQIKNTKKWCPKCANKRRGNFKTSIKITG